MGLALTLSLLTESGCDRGSSAAGSVRPEDAAATASGAASASSTPASPSEEASVKPGINDAWKSDDVAPLIERLESETREVYTHRTELIDAVAPRPGSVVADVGSGSGFLTVELARRVGEAGKVYAVDINEHLLEQVAARTQKAGLHNVQTVHTSDRGIELAPNSVDLMFICDTYHHFEYPKTVLASVFRVLKPGAELVIVDFVRIEGQTEDWILEHVRAGKDEVAAELTEAGFEPVAEHDVPALEQNYVIRFRKPAG